MSSVIYVGMDVHRETFSLCALNPNSGEIITETKCDADVKMIEKFINSLKEQLEENYKFILGYEAGIWGYSLYHKLNDLGYTCIIVAPSTLYSSAQHQMRKNDHQDAQMIAHNLAAKTYKEVRVPDKEDDCVKEFVRLIKALKKEMKRIKQQIRSFVLRNGFRYDAHHSAWTNRYLEWLKSLPLPELKALVLEEYLVAYSELDEKIERLAEHLERISHEKRYQEPVAALRCFRGIETTAAMTIQVETSDFTRFPNAKSYAAYLGLIPSEHSSGNKVSFGRITKQGNSTIRTTLVECTQSLVQSNIKYKSKRIKARQKNQSSAVIAYADRAAKRLKNRYERMLHQGKSRNVAIIAIAREFACFIWGMENKQFD